MDNDTKLNELQIANRAIWTTWLRANPEKQGKYRLESVKNPGTYCCLGGAVLCGLSRPAIRNSCGTCLAYENYPLTEATSLFLPDAEEHLGLIEGGCVWNGERLQALSNLNDADGKTFAEIADLIDLDTSLRS